MTTLIEKISSYNLFNYLLPGVLFAALGERVTEYQFIQDDIVVGLFLYYFIGLVVSRIGSLVVAPTLRKIKFVVFAPYGDFIRASKDDAKLELLSEQNNMYRTLISLFAVLAALKGYEGIATCAEFTDRTNMYILFIILFVMFLFAFRKQTGFIRDRIEATKK